MKIIKVQYTVKSEFAKTNKQNIAKVMEELRVTNRSDVQYTSFQHDDGKTFTHFVIHNSQEAEDYPATLESFKDFQKQLKENLETPPQVENLSFVDSSFDIFK